MRKASLILRQYRAGGDSDEDSPLDRFFLGDEAFQRDVVQPIRDRIAALLNRGNYLSVKAELERIREHVASTDAFITTWRNTAKYAEAIIWILQQKADQSGEDAQIGIAPINIEPDPYGAFWLSAGAVHGEIDVTDLPIENYSTSVRLPANTRLKFGLPAEDNEYVRHKIRYSFKATTVLREAIAQVHDNRARLLDVVRSRQRLLDVFQFREHLLNNALYEYEVSGYVDTDGVTALPAEEAAVHDETGIIHALRLAFEREYAVSWMHEQTSEVSLSKAFDRYECEIEKLKKDQLLEFEVVPVFISFKAFEVEYYRQGFKVLRTSSK